MHCLRRSVGCSSSVARQLQAVGGGGKEQLVVSCDSVLVLSGAGGVLLLHVHGLHQDRVSLCDGPGSDA